MPGEGAGQYLKAPRGNTSPWRHPGSWSSRPRHRQSALGWWWCCCPGSRSCWWWPRGSPSVMSSNPSPPWYWFPSPPFAGPGGTSSQMFTNIKIKQKNSLLHPVKSNSMSISGCNRTEKDYKPTLTSNISGDSVGSTLTSQPTWLGVCIPLPAL